MGTTNLRVYNDLEQRSPECHHAVTRDGIEEPCERMAVALRLDFNWSSAGDPYPVCAQHVGRRKGHMVPLLEVMGAKP